MPSYDFNECHSIDLRTSAKDVFQKMLSCNFSKSLLIKVLFSLRGLRKNIYTIDHLTKMGFIKLEEDPGKEILFGMITNKPMFNSCKTLISAEEFIFISDNSLIKAVINFQVQDRGSSEHTISTETRVWCGNKQLKSKFTYYWFFIKPFSQLIRKAMLQQMKMKITAA